MNFETAEPGSKWVNANGFKYTFIAFIPEAKENQRAIFMGENGEIYASAQDGSCHHPELSIVGPCVEFSTPELWIVTDFITVIQGIRTSEPAAVTLAKLLAKEQPKSAPFSVRRLVALTGTPVDGVLVEGE